MSVSVVFDGLRKTLRIAWISELKKLCEWTLNKPKNTKFHNFIYLCDEQIFLAFTWHQSERENPFTHKIATLKYCWVDMLCMHIACVIRKSSVKCVEETGAKIAFPYQTSFTSWLPAQKKLKTKHFIISFRCSSKVCIHSCTRKTIDVRTILGAIHVHILVL